MTEPSALAVKFKIFQKVELNRLYCERLKCNFNFRENYFKLNLTVN